VRSDGQSRQIPWRRGARCGIKRFCLKVPTTYRQAADPREACSRCLRQDRRPPGDARHRGTLSDHLHARLTTRADLRQTANWSAVLPSIADAAEPDADFASVHSEIQRGHAAPVHAIIRIARGELPAQTDPATTAAAPARPGPATVLAPLVLAQGAQRRIHRHGRTARNRSRLNRRSTLLQSRRLRRLSCELKPRAGFSSGSGKVESSTVGRGCQAATIQNLRWPEIMASPDWQIRIRSRSA
jgi:hypothetical protein